MKSPSKSRIIFAAQVRKHRQERGMTLEQVKAETGLSYNYLSAVENGRTNISLDNMDKIARALRCPLAVLLIDDGGWLAKD